MGAFAAWNHTSKVSALPMGTFGTAIGYLEGQLSRLHRCLENARVDLDNSVIERAIRAIAIGRKTGYFPDPTTALGGLP